MHVVFGGTMVGSGRPPRPAVYADYTVDNDGEDVEDDAVTATVSTGGGPRFDGMPLSVPGLVLKQ